MVKTRMIRSVLTLLLVGVAGCAEGAPPAIPQSFAAHRAGAWQQFCEQASNVPQANMLVAARGSDGWELVAMYNGVLCYKRPMNDPHEAPQQRAPASPQYVPAVRDPGF